MSTTLLSHASRGPHPVGLQHFEIDDPDQPGRRLPIDVWYPADTAGAKEPGLEAAGHPLKLPHAALKEAAPAGGPLPLVVFSHGNSGFRRQSTFLTTHLASWGMLVAAPDHTGNTFLEMTRITDEEQRKRAHFEARRNRPRDLVATIDAVLERHGPWPAVDERHIAAMGHSYGGWSSMKLPARDARVKALCGLAPASEPFVGRKAFEPDELPFDPPRPVLLVAALDDVLVDLGDSILPLFERMAQPKALVGIADCDHFHFCDGVELLHRLHHASPRPKQTRSTRPHADLLPEARVHKLLCGVVTAFFCAVFADEEDPVQGLAPEALAELDPALRRLDAGDSASPV
ncbi:MAG: dienelactone hydrolase family protein [Deltaproteobacteria bacterium]|nr:dienelactone hydrolase family protein [Deltaproteobacteria bacterium]